METRPSAFFIEFLKLHYKLCKNLSKWLGFLKKKVIQYLKIFGEINTNSNKEAFHPF